jgi:hypothetical protein
VHLEFCEWARWFSLTCVFLDKITYKSHVQNGRVLTPHETKLFLDPNMTSVWSKRRWFPVPWGQGQHLLAHPSPSRREVWWVSRENLHQYSHSDVCHTEITFLAICYCYLIWNDSFLFSEQSHSSFHLCWGSLSEGLTIMLLTMASGRTHLQLWALLCKPVWKGVFLL